MKMRKVYQLCCKTKQSKAAGETEGAVAGEEEMLPVGHTQKSGSPGKGARAGGPRQAGSQGWVRLGLASHSGQAGGLPGLHKARALCGHSAKLPEQRARVKTAAGPSAQRPGPGRSHGRTAPSGLAQGSADTAGPQGRQGRPAWKHRNKYINKHW